MTSNSITKSPDKPSKYIESWSNYFEFSILIVNIRAIIITNIAWSKHTYK